MISEFPPADTERHGHCCSPPLAQSEPSPTIEADSVNALVIYRLDHHDVAEVEGAVDVSGPQIETSDIIQDGVQAFAPSVPTGYDNYDSDAESFITASTFGDDLEHPSPESGPEETQRGANGREDYFELKGVEVTEVMKDCSNCESSAAILTVEKDAETKQEVQQEIIDARETSANTSVTSLAEVAIRVASPFLPHWMTSPTLNSPLLCDHSRVDSDRQQMSSSLEPKNKAFELEAPPRNLHCNRRRMDRERHLGEAVVADSYPAALAPSEVAPGHLESYWKMLPSIRSMSIYTDRDASTLYEGSIRSSRTYGVASLLSTRVRMEDAADEDSEEIPRRGVDLPRRVAMFSSPPSNSQHNHHNHHTHHHHHQHHTSAGAEAVGRISTFAVSSGKAAFGYLTESVVPTTVDLAHRSATTTLEAINAGLQLPGIILQHTSLPRLFHHRHHHPSQSPGLHLPLSPSGEVRHSLYGSSAHSHSASAPEMPCLSTGGCEGDGPDTPEPAHLRDHRRSTTDPGAFVQNLTERPRPQPRRKRRYPLQTIPGPDGLDPQIRRELEAQGLASLGLRDGTEGRNWRNWWDPRRYGLPKYVVCHELRTPRPCTIILLMILVICIVCK
ncbi:hypothetical protein EMPS_08968 [Entomortierella parvispora]|uniref:Uncharacterized protein n=1 Tax=Entomortierella parvispora TaxID=205924 RepID=A0A9P3HH31_9FUNG|nr:hypothetical protein EMPS_08968 [Entomortierella parvispora]